jgi:hypothetical protein
MKPGLTASKVRTATSSGILHYCCTHESQKLTCGSFFAQCIGEMVQACCICLQPGIVHTPSPQDGSVPHHIGAEEGTIVEDYELTYQDQSYCEDNMLSFILLIRLYDLTINYCFNPLLELVILDVTSTKMRLIVMWHTIVHITILKLSTLCCK